MDQPLLLLNIVSIIILVVAVVLLAVALRHLARHRREIGELRTTAERHEREMREASVAGAGPTARSRRPAVPLSRPTGRLPGTTERSAPRIGCSRSPWS